MFAISDYYYILDALAVKFSRTGKMK